MPSLVYTDHGTALNTFGEKMVTMTLHVNGPPVFSGG